jgi:hypothetical protein
MKFLFEAHMTNGDIIRQNHEDKGTIEGRNCFADVLARIDDVVAFRFFSDDTIDSIAVNLIDGSFNVNGTRFLAYPADARIPNDARFRLVYFKKVTQRMNQNGEHLGTATEFHCGWQTTVNGKNYQQTCSVS